VRQEGDAAVRQFTERFDKVKLDDICVPTQVWAMMLHAVVRHACAATGMCNFVYASASGDSCTCTARRAAATYIAAAADTAAVHKHAQLATSRCCRTCCQCQRRIQLYGSAAMPPQGALFAQQRLQTYCLRTQAPCYLCSAAAAWTYSVVLPSDCLAPAVGWHHRPSCRTCCGLSCRRK
jgi:hypothetical protein